MHSKTAFRSAPVHECKKHIERCYSQMTQMTLLQHTHAQHSHNARTFTQLAFTFTFTFICTRHNSLATIHKPQFTIHKPQFTSHRATIHIEEPHAVCRTPQSSH